ncbi:MAG: recombinase family protein [Erysipelotrichaceae bacterium]
MGKVNIGYVRVSSKQQATKGFSIFEQTRELLKHAKSLNMELLEENIFADKGYSAKDLKRPMIQKVIKMIAQEEVNTLFVINSDRLTRNPRHKGTLKAVFDRYHTCIESINNDWNTDSIDDEFRNDLKTLLDEMELKKIGPRTIRGLKGSAASGNYTRGGTPPRGYIRVKREEGMNGSYLVPDKENDKYIINIFKCLAEKRYNKLSIAKLYRKNKVMGKYWNDNTITLIVDNPIYYGRFVTSYCDVENHTTPLISKELWMECQNVLKHRSQRTKHFYIYDNMIYCPSCHAFCIQESAWKTSRDGKKKTLYLYYRCPECKQRINENNITNKIMFELDNKKLPENKLDALNILYAKLNKIKVRLRYCESDFDEGVISEIEFREDQIKLNEKKSVIQNEIKKIEVTREEDFMNLSNFEKRSIVRQNIKRIDVNLQNHLKSIKKIIYVNNANRKTTYFENSVENVMST